MPKMVPELLGMLAATLVVIGVGMIHVPAALITAGALLFGIAYLLARD
ncbi:hypothetical protein M9978_02395 [Sphingomonas sp. MG17]|uniref:Uncharacterized protein n=1 Tax=Sphingomonas tagetis TaxID=2949092 RepID=A0A9X2KKE4_9SPHN|nr:hypothetical protein [Sphingomonas tagetis]MCP3729266.1 hypothetical protein [Sphingomonas tagetis]